PWLQPKSGKQYAVYMAVLGAALVGCIVAVLWFKSRAGAVPPVIQKARNLLEEHKYDEAVGLLLPVIQEIEPSGGPEARRLVKHLALLAQVYAAMGKDADAEPLWRRSWQMRVKHLGPDHPESIGSADKLAMALVAQKKFPEAEPLLKKSLAHREVA